MSPQSNHHGRPRNEHLHERRCEEHVCKRNRSVLLAGLPVIKLSMGASIPLGTNAESTSARVAAESSQFVSPLSIESVRRRN